MRYRLPELMDEAGLTSYRVAKLAKEKGREIQTSTITRIVKRRGKVGGFDPAVVEALLAVFDFGRNFNQLIAHSSEPIPKRMSKTERDAIRKAKFPRNRR